MRFTADSENDFGGTLACSHTRHGFNPTRLTDSETTENERETPLGLTRGVFLCHLRAANASRRLSSGVFRLCFGFSAVVIRLSCKCRLKSTLSGFSTFSYGRLSGDSPTLSDSRGATPADSPTLRLSDSPRLPATPRLSDYQRLSTFDPRWIGSLLPRSEIPPGMPERRAAVTISRAVAATIPRVVEERAAGRGESTPKRRAYILREK